MQRVIRPFAITIAALSLAGSAIAAQTKAPSSAAKAAPATQQTSASTSKPAKTKSTSTSLVATGKIATFDAASQALTLTTSKGEQQFTVGPSARLQESSKTITAADLGQADRAQGNGSLQRNVGHQERRIDSRIVVSGKDFHEELAALTGE